MPLPETEFVWYWIAAHIMNSWLLVTTSCGSRTKTPTVRNRGIAMRMGESRVLHDGCSQSSETPRKSITKNGGGTNRPDHQYEVNSPCLVPQPARPEPTRGQNWQQCDPLSFA